MFLHFFCFLLSFGVVVKARSSLNATSTTTFNLDEANKSLWLSAAAYCGTKEIMSHTFTGPTTGFVATATIDATLDVQGFIGYLPSDSAIYVVYRGSSDIQNWIDNLEVLKTPYEGDCCSQSCEVHKGWYKAEQSVIAEVLTEVQRLQAQFPGYRLKITGHSLGAAMAVLTAMDLKNSGLSPTIYDFGRPRVGDSAFAQCASQQVPSERVTHLKDTVPHIPFESWGYSHGLREAYESTTTQTNPQVKDCSSTDGEDATCADQWAFKDTNIDDHLTYLGLRVTCSSV